MYRFHWKDIATETLLNQIRYGLGLDDSESALEEVVHSILENTGGLPLADKEWTPEQRTEIGRRLMQEAIGHGLASLDFRASLPGVIAEPAIDLPFELQLKGTARVNAQNASVSALAALPVIGDSIAERIVQSRRADGPFKSVQDMAARVSGLGTSGASTLAGLLDFPKPTSKNHHSQGFEADLKQFIESVCAKTSIAALETLAGIIANNPHPATVNARLRKELWPEAEALPTPVTTEAVELLEDEVYLPRLLEMIENAASSIEVAMFFMSSGSETHPNTNVQYALKAAKDRGASVRIVLDRDRPDDPYGSEIINMTAIEQLTANGIPVRVDSRERLLHSKCVCFDGQQLMIGSHNWTRSSYETYRDVSVLIHNGTIADAWKQRFETIWSNASDP